MTSPRWPWRWPVYPLSPPAATDRDSSPTRAIKLIAMLFPQSEPLCMQRDTPYSRLPQQLSLDNP